MMPVRRDRQPVEAGWSIGLTRLPAAASRRAASTTTPDRGDRSRPAPARRSSKGRPRAAELLFALDDSGLARLELLLADVGVRLEPRLAKEQLPLALLEGNRADADIDRDRARRRDAHQLLFACCQRCLARSDESFALEQLLSQLLDLVLEPRVDVGIVGCTHELVLGAMELCFTRRKLELPLVERGCACGDRLGLALRLVAGERLAGEHFSLARRDHDLACLKVGETAEALAL